VPRKTRVLVADEDGIMRDGLCALLQSDDALEVVAATAIRGDALQTLTTAQPDIIIIDFAADIKSGPETIAQVRRRWPDVRVLVLTVRRDETFIEQLESGARVNMTPAIFSLGGATLDNEWNHIQQKLMRGLGIVAIENQARI